MGFWQTILANTCAGVLLLLIAGGWNNRAAIFKSLKPQPVSPDPGALGLGLLASGIFMALIGELGRRFAPDEARPLPLYVSLPLFGVLWLLCAFGTVKIWRASAAQAGLSQKITAVAGLLLLGASLIYVAIVGSLAKGLPFDPPPHM